MGSREEDLELGAFPEGGPDNHDRKSVKSGRKMSSDIRVNVFNENGGEDTSVVDSAPSKLVGLNPKQFRLRRAVSDVRFKAKLAPVHPDKKDFGTWGTFVLAYQTLGIVFGGLVTSPLYVWPTIQLTNPGETEFLGVMSLIFWTFTLVALVKYGLIVINADDHGEGGTFAVYSILCRNANFGQRIGDPSDFTTAEESKNTVTDSNSAVKLRRFFEDREGAKFFLFVICMLGTGLVIGDGILTPAISVLSAMAGIQSEDPSIQTPVVTWVSAAILVALFLMQRFGTSKIGFLFSPIMLTWLLVTPVIGVYNIAKYYPSIFKAISPHYIIEFFKKNKKDGWIALGGVVLCITGAEASYADLGHFNKRSIQMAFFGIVYPSAMLTYAGESAYCMAHPEDHKNAFFKSVPHSVYWPVFVVATLAAIVASQSLITATFSLIKQCTSLGCFPRVKMVHTNADQEGQVYSPEINYILMVICVAVVLGFQDAVQLGNAFGVAVVGVMFITTILVTMVMILVWKLPLPVALLFLAVFGFIEGVYFTAVLNKVPQGGWVPFAMATIFLAISLCWNYGRRKKYAYEMTHKTSLDCLGSLLSSGGTQRVPGICFFYSDLALGVPPIITHYVKNVRTLHQVLVFTTIRFLPVRTVPNHERIFVGRVGFKGVYRCVACYGYQDVIDCNDRGFRDLAIESLRLYLENEERNEPDPNGNEVRTVSFQQTIADQNVEDVAELNEACKHDAVYVVGKVTVRTNGSTGWLPRLIIDKAYSLLRVICRSAIKELQIPPANYLEVGMLYEI
ncbi:hypothetical protein KC19_3G023400 [Ceratodon purpureus]|uniref:Potassium transporter n=1 Tax=Ceratodon purpureus TaxID=3225 RepID=A0A8T0IE04_CERPU|nr:hypothetical protein KC19_3G023400 [Ceratodon purpureus]